MGSFERLRVKFIDWILEVIHILTCHEDTFYLCVDILDRFLMNSKYELVKDEFHLIGITALFMASKVEEIYPVKMKVLVEKVGHNKFSEFDIIEMEAKILRKLDYKIVNTLTVGS